MLRSIRRALLLAAAAAAAAASALAAAPAIAGASLADKSSDAAALTEQARAGGAAVIVEVAAPALAQIETDRASAKAKDAAREKVVAAAVDGFVDRFFAGGNDRAAASKRALKKMRYAPLVAFVATSQDLERLAGDPTVVRIHQDTRNELKLTQSVPLIGMPQTWAKDGTGADTVVAVLDTGVQSTHPFFGGRVVMQACFSASKVVGPVRIVGLCPNGEPFQIGGNAGRNCPMTDDGCEHGTHVAGIIAGDNPKPSEPPSGVAPKAGIIAVQVFSREVGRGVSTQASDYIAALEFLYSVRDHIAGGKRLAAINMSFGGAAEAEPCVNHPARPIIRLLREAGVASLIATGNEFKTASIDEPACVPEAVRVGSTTKTDLVSSFSNAAGFMDVFAPGDGILSSVPMNKYKRESGTSMATPTVAGAFAALRSAVPEATVEEILDALVATGKPIRDSRFGGTVTKPRIQVDKALRELKGRHGNLLASPRRPIVLPPGQGKPVAFSVTLSTRTGAERWRLVSKPDWLVAMQQHGTANKAGQRVPFWAKALGEKEVERTGWLVFAGGDAASPSRLVRVEQRRERPLLVVDVKDMHPLRVSIRNGVATPSRFTVDVFSTVGKVPFEIVGLPDWLEASETSGIATPAKRTISFRVVPPRDLKNPVTRGAAFLQTDIGYEAMDLTVELVPAGGRADATAAALAQQLD
jgi:subtilisin family serine protease